jgi:hypothetical protein
VRPHAPGDGNFPGARSYIEHCDSNTDARGLVADGSQVRNSWQFDIHANAGLDRFSHAYAYIGTHRNLDSNARLNRDCVGHRHFDANSNEHADSYADTVSNVYINVYTNIHIDANAHGHSDPHTHANRDAVLSTGA